MRTFVTFASDGSPTSPALDFVKVGPRFPRDCLPSVRFPAVHLYRVHAGQPVSSQAIGHYLLGTTVPLPRFLQEFQRGLLAPMLRYETLENFTLAIDGLPKVVLLAVDLHNDLVHMLTPRALSHHLVKPLTDLRGKHWPEPMPLEPHRLMADVGSALVQKVLRDFAATAGTGYKSSQPGG